MKNRFKMLISFVLFSLILLFCKGGDPNVPGETKENPLSFHVSDFASGKVEVKKLYLAVKGIPLNRHIFLYI